MIALVFDTETTGLTKNRTVKLDLQPEIIEFTGLLVDLKTGKAKKTLDLLVKPSKPLSDTPAFGEKKTITDITGITNAMLMDAQYMDQQFDSIVKLIESSPVVIAHNASFDKEMIDIEAQRLGRVVKWPRVICTVEQTLHLKGHRLTMTKLYQELFGEAFAGAHRSRADVEALVRICVELFKRGII
jgi:DNA polymerase III alpha subunit (gram-positive type)